MRENDLVSRAVGRLDRDKWIPLTEFQVGIRESLGMEYSEYSARQTRKRESPLFVDLLLVGRQPSRPERDDHELEHYKEWKGKKYAYKVLFNPEAPSWRGEPKQIFLSEMGRLLEDRDVVIVECKTLKAGEGKGGYLQEYGPHQLFHGAGQVLLYHLLFRDDYPAAGMVRTALLTDEYLSIERGAFDGMRREHPGLGFPPFDTEVWTLPLTDREFFVPESRAE